ncbi:type 1 secretion target domain-containng protein [Enterobacter cloacae]|uniref:Type 1 secretion target domain-containng protein n=1 Tax=Enterobacter cloacae TaxID=550 RepID=A0A377LZT5_ENTCL|nr:type 1 secretion target domain-containng protein [Enterobacter cloacae]
MAAVDYNWDGAQDLLVSQQNGKVVLVQNSKTIADGTAMHLHIVDSEGINAYYGNTVNLYNAAGVLVASQIINAQSGIGSNDTSALVSFYGLDPNETYSAEIVKITNGVSDNVTWSGLEASNGKEGYVLTAEAATGGHSGTITGTGYNDTFIAEDGTYTYNVPAAGIPTPTMTPGATPVGWTWWITVTQRPALPLIYVSPRRRTPGLAPRGC